MSSAGALLSVIGVYGQSYDDLWDISQGTQILAHSTLTIPQFDARDVFGGFFGTYAPEFGAIGFSDNKPPGTVDFIEWRTILPVALSGFILYANGDGGDSGYREFESFALKTRSSENSGFDITLFTITPSHPYNFAVFSGSFLETIIAQDFRAEFVNSGDVIPSHRGPRVVELDAIAAPVPESPVSTLVFVMSALAASTHVIRRSLC